MPGQYDITLSIRSWLDGYIVTVHSDAAGDLRAVIPSLELPADPPGVRLASVLYCWTFRRQDEAHWCRARQKGGCLLVEIGQDVAFKHLEAGLQQELERALAPKTGHSPGGFQALIRSAFSEEELRRFCRDRAGLRRVMSSFSAADGLDSLAFKLIEFADKNALFDELAGAIEEANPRRYQQFHTQLYEYLPLLDGVAVPTPLPLDRQAHLAFQLGQDCFDKGEWLNAIEEFARLRPGDADYQEAKKLLRIAQDRADQERRVRQEMERLNALYQRAQEHIKAQEWERAGLLLEGLAQPPAFRDAEELLRTVQDELEREREGRRIQRELAFNYERALKHYQAGEWDDAIRFLGVVSRQDRTYRDVAARLDQAYRQRQLEGLDARAQQAAEEGDWGTAVQLLGQIESMQAGYREVRERLAQAQRQERLASLYQAAERDLNDGLWASALLRLREVSTIADRYRDTPLALQYTAARVAMDREQWHEARQQLRAIVQIDPGYRDAAACLRQAQTQAQLADLYERGSLCLQNGQWIEAQNAFEQLTGIDPGYRDAGALGQQAQEEGRLAEAYNRAARYLALKQWAEAGCLLQEIAAERPGYRDVAARLENAKQEQYLEDLYRQGIAQSDVGNWREAILAFEPIIHLAPDYRDAADRLESARRQVELVWRYDQGLLAFQQEQWDDAIDALEQVVARESSYREASVKLAEARKQKHLSRFYQEGMQYFEDRQWAQATRCFEEVAAKDPDYRQVGARLEESRRQAAWAQLFEAAQKALNQGLWSQADDLLTRLPSDYREGFVLQMAAHVERQQELERRYRQARQLCDAQEWTEALSILQGIEREQPGYDHVALLVEETWRQATLGQHYQAGLAAYQAQDWDRAIEELDQVVQIEADYRDALTRLSEARRARRLAQLSRSALAHEGGREWDQAIADLETIVRLDPGYGQAEQKLAAVRTQKQLQAWYEAGLAALEAGEWKQAAEPLRRVLAVDPAYLDAGEHLARAEAELQLDEWYENGERYLEHEQWAEAVEQLEWVEARRPGYRDVRERLQAARAGRERQLQDELQGLYARAEQLLAAERRREAAAILQEVCALDPGYRDARLLLRQAQRPSLARIGQALAVARSRSWPWLRFGSVAVALAIVLCAAALLVAALGSGGAPAAPPPGETAQSPAATLLATGRPSPGAIAVAATRTGPARVPVMTVVWPTAAPTGEVAPALPTPVPSATPTAPAAATATPSPTVLLKPSSPPPAPAGRIAFPLYDPARQAYDVYISSTDGSGRRLLVAQASQPALSPDGARIAFRSWDSGSRGLAIMDLDGSERRNVSHSFEDARPSWAANGSLVLFSRREGDRKGRLYLYRPWGAAEATLLQHGPAPAYGETPSWLGAGRIVYHLCDPNCAIAVTDENGSTPRRLLDNASKTAPAGSPDGRQIAFMSSRDGNWEIYSMDSQGHNLARLTDDPAVDGLPTWSPDGSWLAFVSNRTGGQTWSVWAIRPDGSGLQKLFDLGGTIDGVVAGEPTYSSAGWKEEQISWSW